MAKKQPTMTQADLLTGLAEEILECIDKYEGTTTAAAVVGVLELVKTQIIFDQFPAETEEEDEE